MSYKICKQFLHGSVSILVRKNVKPTTLYCNHLDQPGQRVCHSTDLGVGCGLNCNENCMYLFVKWSVCSHGNTPAVCKLFM